MLIILNPLKLEFEKFDMKLYYGLRNLRSIELDPPVELRPLTILLGKNNIGKSTLLRSIPLLKQSIEANNGVAVKWSGEYVDFGKYSTAIKYNCENEGVMFQFGIEDFIVRNQMFYSSRKHIGLKTDFDVKFNERVDLKILVAQQDDLDFVKESSVEIPEYNIDFKVKYSDNGALEIVRGKDFSLPEEFLHLWFEPTQKHVLSQIKPMALAEDGFKLEDIHSIGNVFVLEVGDIIDSNTGDEVVTSQITEEALKILEYPALDNDILEKLTKTADESFQFFYSKLQDRSSKTFKQINGVCGFVTAIATYNQIVQTFSELFQKSIYFGPSRFGIGRDNRIEPIGKMVVSHNGQNLADFLAKLNDDQVTRFSEWINNYFKIGISIQKLGDRLSILIESEEDKSANLVDSGFGISEILPFLTQIWYESIDLPNKSKLINSGKTNVKSEIEERQIIAIEQPELHLHPQHQANLADLFAHVASSYKNTSGGQTIKPIYLIETHSETIISRLGELVEYGEISNDDIQILLFSKKIKDGQDIVSIQRTKYNEKGYLQDWPYGFFEYKYGPKR